MVSTPHKSKRYILCFIKFIFFILEVQPVRLIRQRWNTISVHTSETEVAALLLHEDGFVGCQLADLGLIFGDGVWPVVVAIDDAARQEFTPGAGCGIAPDGIREMETVAIERVAQAITGQLDGGA